MSRFTGLISDSFKQVYIDMITELIRGCSVNCTVSFGITLWDDCPNCLFDPIGGKSSNRWQTGGPAPFTVGKCPMCYGEGKIPHEETETISLAPIYDYHSWIPGLSTNIQSPEGFIQTLSEFSTYDTLSRAKDIIIDTDLSSSVVQRFERYSEPEPCGLGSGAFIMTMWKLIENGQD